MPFNTMLFNTDIISSLLRLLRNGRLNYSTDTALQLTMYCNDELELSQIQEGRFYFSEIKAKIKILMNNIYDNVTHKIHITYAEDAYHLVFVHQFPYGINGPCYDYYDHGQVLRNNLIITGIDHVGIYQNLISFRLTD